MLNDCQKYLLDPTRELIEIRPIVRNAKSVSAGRGCEVRPRCDAQLRCPRILRKWLIDLDDGQRADGNFRWLLL